MILRNVAGKVCRFRCIDDDYQDGSGNYGKRALFLAECVIRSDVESTYEERVLLRSGRIIILRNPGKKVAGRTGGEYGSGCGLCITRESVTAFTGRTETGGFAQTRMDGLRSCRLSYQECRDPLLSAVS